MTREDLMTCEEIAELVDRSVPTIWRWNGTGRMPAPVIATGRCCWSRREIEAWIAGGCKSRAEWEERKAVARKR